MCIVSDESDDVTKSSVYFMDEKAIGFFSN